MDVHIHILHVNLRGFLSHKTELEARIAKQGLPELVGITETHLDKSVPAITLSNYTLISRLDRRDGRQGGGIAFFALASVAPTVVHIGDSVDHERSWHILHSNMGPVLLALWYRPPSYQEDLAIVDLEMEWHKYSGEAVATMIFGDMNVHHTHWLKHSIGVQPAGSQLFGVCSRLGLAEKVQQPTRGKNLLDLFLTDATSGVTCKVLPKIADHNLVLTRVALQVTLSDPVARQLWDYKKSDWQGLLQALGDTDWHDYFSQIAPDEAAAKFTDHIICTARRYIPVRLQSFRPSSHPWLNDRCFSLIQSKIDAEGTPEYAAKQYACTKGMLEEHEKYVQRTRAKITSLQPSSKKWWKLSGSLMLKANQTSAIPPIKSEEGIWCLKAEDKANAFAQSFGNKFVMPDGKVNQFSAITESDARMSGFLPIRRGHVLKILKALREDSSTGPDQLAARLLRKCAAVLAVPIALLVRIILKHGIWPESWKLHWIHPLHKKASRSDPKHYRGIHLTAQLSKVAERLLGLHLCTFLESSLAFGKYQFAYIRGRGYRDALAFNVFTWVWAFGNRKRIGLYCSDVAGAFDRVNSERLLAKLRAKGVHEQLLRVISSWLGARRAHVCVEGVLSEPFLLSNMVFQGTVWGPSLWNSYYADAGKAVELNGFLGTVFADDLNCFKLFDSAIGNAFINKESHKCQESLHEWGRANQVVFEPSKESFHILDSRHPFGGSFKMLSVPFDTKLQMFEAAIEFASVAGWRLKTLLRARRFYEKPALIGLYKSHILSFIEGATPAIYHAAPGVLKIIDDTQESFLHQIEMSQQEAFLEFNLAPLGVRKDIAMLGILCKVCHNKAPPPLQGLFQHCGGRTLTSYSFRTSDVLHDKALHDPVEPGHPLIIRRSIYGLVKVFNRLPQHFVDSKTTQEFQRRLQNCAKDAASENAIDWQLMFRA